MGPDKIESFNGEYRFLSNFWPSPIRLSGIVYPTVEAAFQAAKTLDEKDRAAIAAAKTPGEAKRLGRRVTLRPNWDDMRIEVMRACLKQKFSRNPLRERLLSTGDADLVEGNTWGDVFWGVSNGVGTNWLGRLLMERRGAIRAEIERV